MKRFLAAFLVLLTSLSFGNAKVWAKDKAPATDTTAATTSDVTDSQDAADADDPSAISVSDLELINKKISDLAKYAKVSLLVQGQYTNASQFGTVAPGIKAPVAPAAAGFNDIYDQFSVKRVEIGLFGDLIPGQLSYQVKYDPAAATAAVSPSFTSPFATPVTAAAVSKPGVSNGEQLKDYYVKASYIPFADLQFGQYKYAQALEGRTPSGELDFINTALVTTAFEARRDLALQASASKIPVGPVAVDYALALVSGAGQNIADSNDNKDAAFRGGVDWTGLGATGLWTGLSFYGGWEQDALFSVTSAAGKTSTVYAPAGERSNTGFELRWVYNGFKLQGEYIQGKLEPGNYYNPSTTKESWPQGYYLTAQYRIGDVRFGVRGESYIANVYNGPAHWNNDVATAGIDWYQAKDRFKLSLNVEDHFKQYQAVIGQAEINL